MYKNMGVLDEIIKNKQRGDAVRIADAVNRKREKMGLEPYSFGTIRSMLNGNRTLTDEVKEISDKYYEAINEFDKMIMI